MGTTDRRRWKVEEILRLRELYPDHSTKGIAFILGRSYTAVKTRARVLHLHKSSKYWEKRRKYFVEEVATKNPRHRGIPIAEWMPAEALAKREAYFKSKREAPIDPATSGHIVGKTLWVVRDGKRINVKKLYYERYFGEIPVGYIIRCLDGNPRNLARENLVAETRGEQMRREKLTKGSEQARKAWRTRKKKTETHKPWRGEGCIPNPLAALGINI